MRRPSVSVRLAIPFVGDVRGTWEPDVAERKAAWEIYVEMVTRIGVVELRPDDGSLREALTSMYSLFDATRKILREGGPSLASPRRRPAMRLLGGRSRQSTPGLSLGAIALAILNGAIRPVLARWHPLLSDYEMSRPDDVPPLAHERAWAEAALLRDDLNALRGVLLEAARLLADAAAAGDLTPLVNGETSRLLPPSPSEQGRPEIF
ncbi:hypothetical protein Adi01nite_00960 [Amorphoplanes digitatis]|uniref:Uncharacterized protein n=1 Tax=Actinoplanes digitatis TaxID=1868 RepID=A0A7W7HVM3_9ACTN|nr:hypothetical protein [Actinoplanes digitatis]MBB4761575.1 hypothetical protein [Actinoplanes digitatis]BFE70120.1 hypothetical protein GCM10020092_034210 [Actinoplanes digitatis]GID90684.1 hypothetical protein Adi01nite_00960 [Actinoplanes digitatis]